MWTRDWVIATCSFFVHFAGWLLARVFTRPLRHVLAPFPPLHLPYLAFVCLLSFISVFQYFESIFREKKCIPSSTTAVHLSIRPSFWLPMTDFWSLPSWVSFKLSFGKLLMLAYFLQFWCFCIVIFGFALNSYLFVVYVRFSNFGPFAIVGKSCLYELDCLWPIISYGMDSCFPMRSLDLGGCPPGPSVTEMGLR